MKIGILTFHAAHNYGAVLQCYALQEYFCSIGAEAEVIDHRIPEMLEDYKCFSWKLMYRRNPFGFLRNILDAIIGYRSKYKRCKRFETFINSHFTLVSESSIESKHFDVICVGSDQVWNTRLTYGFDSYYWGNFSHPESTKLVTYAASMRDFKEVEDKSRIVTYLKNFKFISVREESLAKDLNSLINENRVVTVADPTLLLPSIAWSNIAKRPDVKERYVFLYQVNESQSAYKVACKYAEKLGLRLVVLTANNKGFCSDECKSAGPEEFLGLFKYASFVVASSFHGTVFSLIFNKPFVSVRKGTGIDTRIENLLGKINLLQLFVKPEDPIVESHLREPNADFTPLTKFSKLYIDRFV